MAAAEKRYTLENGATFKKAWEIRDISAGTPGTARNLTGCVVRLQLRTSYDAEPLLSLASNTGASPQGSTLVIESPATAGRIRLTITDEETAYETGVFPSTGTVYGHLELVPASGEVERVLAMTIKLSGEYTHA